MILALHCLGHDTGISLIKNNRLIFSIESERMTRRKHENDISSVFDWFVNHSGYDINDVNYVVFSTPIKNSIAKIENYETLITSIGPENLLIESFTTITGRRIPCLIVAHELCHAGAAFGFLNNADNAICLVNEGRGHFSRNCVIERRDGKYSILEHDKLPWFGTGFGWTAIANKIMGVPKSPSAAGKAMGFSAYGTYDGIYEEIIRSINPFVSEMDMLTAATLAEKSISVINRKMTTLLKANFVNTFQIVFSNAVDEYVAGLKRRYENTPLCLSGGCALNLPANSILKRKYPKEISIPPNCNDSGQSVGAAVIANHYFTGKIISDLSVYSCGEDTALDKSDLKHFNGYEIHDYDSKKIANFLAEGSVVAVCRGKSELGPRALGNRSILASANWKGMKDRINNTIKDREWYRPVGGIIRRNNIDIVSHDSFESPYMLFNYEIKPAYINEAVHVDNTSRLQTVTKENDFLDDLLVEYEKASGNHVLINTSLNARDVAVALGPKDVIADFSKEDIDVFIFNDKYITVK